MPRRARPRRRPGESYEERSERRQEAREGMCHRNNVTSCRQPARPAPRSPHSPRQKEFLRRRNLPGEALGTLLGQEPKERTVLEPGPSILLQVTQLRAQLRAQPAPATPGASASSPNADCTDRKGISHRTQSQLWGHTHRPAPPLFAKPSTTRGFFCHFSKYNSTFLLPGCSFALTQIIFTLDE